MLKFTFIFPFLSANIFKKVVMVTKATAELISDKFYNPYLRCFQKIYALCGLLLLFHEIQVNERVSCLTKVRKPKN